MEWPKFLATLESIAVNSGHVKGLCGMKNHCSPFPISHGIPFILLSITSSRMLDPPMIIMIKVESR